MAPTRNETKPRRRRERGEKLGVAFLAALALSLHAAAAHAAEPGAIPPTAHAQRAEPWSPDPAPVSRMDLDGADGPRRQGAPRVYRYLQVVGGSMFAVSYGPALVAALLCPGPDVDAEQEETVSRLIIPVVGPFIASAEPSAPRLVFLTSGIVQLLSVATLTWGTIGVATSTPDPPPQPAIQVLPLAPGDAAPGLSVVGRF